VGFGKQQQALLIEISGVYGFKPTSGRLPVNGWTAAMGGAEQIVPTIGPLSTSLAGCKLFTKTLIDAKPWLKEPSLLPFPWKEEESFVGKKLRVAVLWDDGVVKPHPPITRALQQVVDKLKANGDVEIIEWKPYKHDLAWEIIVSTLLYLASLRSSPTILTYLHSAGESLLLRRWC
jgi:amidase